MSIVKLSRLANQLLGDLEAIPLPKFSQAWEERAVGMILEAFEAATMERDAEPIQTDRTLPYGTAEAAQEASMQRLGCRWCSKCQRSYWHTDACPHFAPYSQAP